MFAKMKYVFLILFVGFGFAAHANQKFVAKCNGPNFKLSAELNTSRGDGAHWGWDLDGSAKVYFQADGTVFFDTINDLKGSCTRDGSYVSLTGGSVQSKHINFELKLNGSRWDKDSVTFGAKKYEIENANCIFSFVSEQIPPCPHCFL